jgi:hypothetical protein
MSFPSLATRSFPGPRCGKQALAALAAGAVLAGCGGSATQYRVVEGRGYSFEAPVGWTIVHTPRAIGMQHGSVDLVQVTRLPLVRPYRPQLFNAVIPELDRTATELANDTGATLQERQTVQVLGQSVRQYVLRFSGHVEQLTFVLHRKSNYQLLCRREENGDDAACTRLVSSFRIF